MINDVIEQINHKIKIKNKFISENKNIPDKYSFVCILEAFVIKVTNFKY